RAARPRVAVGPGAGLGRGLGRGGRTPPPRRAGLARGHVLGGDIDHPGVPRLVQVRQTCLRHGSEITSATSPAAIEATSSGTTISALARASAPSWCEPWPVSAVTVAPSAPTTPP